MDWKKLRKLAACMEAASQGGELTIGFLGGSITQGSLASEHQNTYAYRVFCWWCESFPNAEFHYVNGGIGGTTSHFGAARAVEDVLMYQPDVVMVDFSVNDDPNVFFQETFEGVLRKILGWQSEPAALVLNNVFYDTGVNAQEYHNPVAEHYQVPFVSIRDSIYQEMKAGKYTREEMTPDGLHPNDLGHSLVAGEIIRLLEFIKGNRKEILQEWKKNTLYGEGRGLPDAFTANAYENAQRLTIRNALPGLYGFRADTGEKLGHLDHFKSGWMGRKEGDKIVFQVKGSCIAAQYRKTIQKPAPVARVVVDGREDQAVILDGNFEETWGDCLYLQPLLHHGEAKVHRVEIEIVESHKEDQVPFYLLSLIVA